jgi:molybdate transport system substrate-binding protein
MRSSLRDMHLLAIARVPWAAVLVTALTHSPAEADELKVFCSNGIQAVLNELIPQFERATPHKVLVTYGVSAELKRKIDAGESFDLALLTPALLDDAISRARIDGATRTGVARSAMALAIRAGTVKPDITTTDALQRTLLASKSIAYAKEGAGGVFFTALIERLGIAETLNARIRPTMNGDEVSAAVARGDAELGVLPVSEILPVAGIEMLGTFPAEVQGYLNIVAGVGSGSSDDLAARQLIRFLTSTVALAVLSKHGMERPVM